MPAGGKEILLLLLLAVLVDIRASAAKSPKCNKTPGSQLVGQTRGDQGFSVALAGAPRLYRPGQPYVVSLSGTRDGETSHVKFIDFMITAESDRPSTEVFDLGVFHLVPTDTMVMFSHHCPNAVEAASALSKEEVSVTWTAPQSGSGCIMIKAMVVERNDFWYMDDGALTFTICEDNSPVAEGPLVEPCTACSEAKYELIFEGLWSRHTHPRDFPSDEWQTQFSKLIGASHGINYSLWKYGQVASPALAQMAESGRTRKLELDMKSHSQSIRSVLKARGLKQRSNLVSRSSAVFRTDSTNHLLSVVSKLLPSPDWIVGVSLENLCLPNGSWVDYRSVDLFPLDAGTDSGLGYEDAGNRTSPPAPVHRITSCNPSTQQSPFYEPACAPIKPVARLSIIKQREYARQCASGPGAWETRGISSESLVHGRHSQLSGYAKQPGYPPRTNDPSSPIYNPYMEMGFYADQPATQAPTEDPVRSAPLRSRSITKSPPVTSRSRCTVAGWSAWSPCSATCSHGYKIRSRVYLGPVTKARPCNRNLLERRGCLVTTTCPPSG